MTVTSKTERRRRAARAAEFRANLPALEKDPRVARVNCLEVKIGQFRIWNHAGGFLDYWASTATFRSFQDHRGTGLEEALSILPSLAPRPDRERFETGAELITIFTDASFDLSTRSGGWASWTRTSQGGDYDSGPLTGAGNAFEAEMCALANGLAAAVRRGAVTDGCAVLLQSDCMNALQLILTMVHGTRNSSASGGLTVDRLRAPKARQVANKALAYISKVAGDKGLKLFVRHVKGHTKGSDARSYVNAQCDRMARTHMKDLQRQRREALSA